MEEKLRGRKYKVCSNSDDLKATVELKAKQRQNLPDQPNYPPWVRAYQAHLDAVNNMKAKVDTSPPMISAVPYTASNIAFNRKGLRYQKIVVENSMLLKKISDIYTRKKAFIDNQYGYKDIMRNRGILREREQMRQVFENVHLYNKIQKVKAVESRVEHAKWYKEQEKFMQRAALYPLHFKALPCSSKVGRILQRASANPVIKASFQLTTEEGKTGHLTFELYSNICPFTVENFRRMCKTKDPKMNWKGKGLDKLVSVVLPDGQLERMYWQVGKDAGVYPILKSHMSTERSSFQHNKAWLLTKPKEIATGEFYITSHPAPYLDKLCNVFGKVVGEEGIQFLGKMERHHVDPAGNTRSKIIISGCAILDGTEDANANAQEAEEDEEDE